MVKEELRVSEQLAVRLRSRLVQPAAVVEEGLAVAVGILAVAEEKELVGEEQLLPDSGPT
jgi:hypothetical protein